MTEQQYKAVKSDSPNTWNVGSGYREIQRLQENARNALVYYRGLLPKVSVENVAMTYYSIGETYVGSYFMKESDAAEKLVEILQEYREMLSQISPERRSSSVLHEIKATYQEYGIQQHTGDVLVYTVEYVSTKDYPNEYDDVISIDPATVDDIVYKEYAKLKRLEIELLEFVGLEYHLLDGSNEVHHARDMHIYYTAPFQKVMQRFQHEAQEYDGLLHFIFVKAGLNDTDIWKIYRDISDLRIMKYHIMQYAVQLWYKHWSLDIAPNFSSDVPQEWEEAMINYQYIAETIINYVYSIKPPLESDNALLYLSSVGAIRYSTNQ